MIFGLPIQAYRTCTHGKSHSRRSCDSPQIIGLECNKFGRRLPHSARVGPTLDQIRSILCVVRFWPDGQIWWRFWMPTADRSWPARSWITGTSPGNGRWRLLLRPRSQRLRSRPDQAECVGTSRIDFTSNSDSEKNKTRPDLCRMVPFSGDVLWISRRATPIGIANAAASASPEDVLIFGGLTCQRGVTSFMARDVACKCHVAAARPTPPEQQRCRLARRHAGPAASGSCRRRR